MAPWTHGPPRGSPARQILPDAVQEASENVDSDRVFELFQRLRSLMALIFGIGSLFPSTLEADLSRPTSVQSCTTTRYLRRHFMPHVPVVNLQGVLLNDEYNVSLFISYSFLFNICLFIRILLRCVYYILEFSDFDRSL